MKLILVETMIYAATIQPIWVLTCSFGESFRLAILKSGLIQYSEQGIIQEGRIPGISPPKGFLTPPRIFTIKIYINEISYVLHYSNGKQEQYREGNVEAIAYSKMINSNKL